MIRRLLFAVAVVLAASGGADAYERITRFVSDVDVQTNGDLVVTETITVQAENRQIRRGILRDFPTTYRAEDGRRVVVGFKLLSVRRDDGDEYYSTQSLYNGIRIRIGSAYATLKPGLHTYVIRYRVTRIVGFFPDFDELYWNVTGTGWAFDIDVAEARITLPPGAKIHTSKFFTGPQGAKGNDAAVVEESDNRIVFRTTRKLGSNNGLTVAIAWQKGVVSPPGPIRQFRYFVTDNIAASLSVFGLLMVVTYFFYQWLRYGRDPAPGTIIPVFEPPAGMSAAGMRYVDNFATYDDKTFAAAIVELGVKKRLKISEEKGVTRVEKQSGGEKIYDGEEAVMRHFFTKEKSLELKQANHVRVGGANDALKANLKRMYDDLFRNNYGKWGVGLLLTAIAVVLALTGIVLQFSSRYAGDAFIGTLLPIIPLLLASFALNNGFTARRGNGFLLGVGVIFGIVPAVIGLWYVWRSVEGIFELIPTICAFAATMLCAFFLEWMEAPTREGRKVLDQIEGLREYMSTADEESRLEYLNPPKKTPELFERMLPYAIALDVENSWAKKFAGVLAAAAAAPAAAAAAGYAVNQWYSGRSWSDTASFTNSIANSLSATVASASIAPGTSGSYSGSSSSYSSSGSSGGGFSGGGGGGGGGSGW